MSTIIAHDINNAWRDSMGLCIREGKDYIVEGGSYLGQIRRQLEYVTIIINEPWTRPLAPITPPGVPGPTSEEKIFLYFLNYIFGSTKAKGEVYTYGEFITKQYTRCLELLADSKGHTNQATIAIGDITTTFLPDPPCLRSISLKVVNGSLNLCAYFRSWDLYAGLPENLGGLQMLKEMIVSELEGVLPIEDGKLIAFSDGLHIYEQYFGLVNLLNVDKVEWSKEIEKEKRLFIAHHGV